VTFCPAAKPLIYVSPVKLLPRPQTHLLHEERREKEKLLI